MKLKHVAIFLAVEAAVCVCARILLMGSENVSSSISLLAFPFEQIGLGLRALSLSGAAGNMAAIVLYCAFCLLPAVYLAFRVVKKRSRAEDALLAVLSAVLFFAIYRMINPGDINAFYRSRDIAAIGKSFIGGTIYSILFCYIVLRILRTFSGVGTSSLLRYLSILLAVICALLVFAVFGAGLYGLIINIRQLESVNTAVSGQLGVSRAFLVLQYLVSVLPSIMEIAIIFAGFGLIRGLEREPYGGETVTAARRMGKICTISVAAVMLSQAAVNFAQFMLAALVRSANYTLSIPLMSVAFALAALLLARYFEQGKKLKDDNDMFI